MQKPIEFYQKQVQLFQEKLRLIKRKLVLFALIRLSIFLGSVLGIYFTIDAGSWPMFIFLISVVGFLYFVSKYEDLRQKKESLTYLININTSEIYRIEGRDVEANDGGEFNDGLHPFSSDVDLFGEGSFFQLIDRTELIEGKEKLANILQANDIENVVMRQELIKELAEIPEWRQAYKVSAHFVQTDVSRKSIVNWLNDYKSLVPKAIFAISSIFPFLTIGVLGLYFFNIIPALGILVWLFVRLLITGPFIKKINRLSIHVGQLKQAFLSYAKLIEFIENRAFISALGQEKKKNIQSDLKLASEILSEFSKYLSALDQRNNILFAVMGNGFLLWDCKQTYKIEKWIETHAHLVEKWFETVEFFDAFNSLGTYGFNYSQFTYPEIVQDTNVLIEADQLGHPMIEGSKRIDNDFKIDKTNYKIITGANMAGKSTFLRTVAVSIFSANIGLPICAKSYKYSPIKLITSMRNTDSLKDDSSYFFAELVRLKYIVNAIKNEPYFIILDEILKGTNSKDKEEGSKKFMIKLSQSSSSGIIATHDLGLCEIANEISTIQNHYFDAEIIADELNFDYLYKTGICKNMNASFLLKKMEIV